MWREIDGALAQKHPAYGVKGWVVVILALLALALLRNALAVLGAGQPQGAPAFGDWPATDQSATLSGMAVSAMAVAAGALKHRSFRIWLAALLAVVAFGVVLPGLLGFREMAPIPELTPQANAAVARFNIALGYTLLGVVSAMLWYAVASERANVTYLRRVKAPNVEAHETLAAAIAASELSPNAEGAAAATWSKLRLSQDRAALTAFGDLFPHAPEAAEAYAAAAAIRRPLGRDLLRAGGVMLLFALLFLTPIILLTAQLSGAPAPR